MRRAFMLPEEDVDFLDSKSLQWETINYGGCQWVLLHDFLLPKGYNHETVTAAIQITSSYPTSQLDMVYFYPSLRREDNVVIGAADQPMEIEGKTYQRWSRHYPWKAGLHSLATHIQSIELWLLREFQIKPMQGVANG